MRAVVCTYNLYVYTEHMHEHARVEYSVCEPYSSFSVQGVMLGKRKSLMKSIELREKRKRRREEMEVVLNLLLCVRVGDFVCVCTVTWIVYTIMLIVHKTFVLFQGCSLACSHLHNCSLLVSFTTFITLWYMCTCLPQVLLVAEYGKLYNSTTISSPIRCTPAE